MQRVECAAEMVSVANIALAKQLRRRVHEMKEDLPSPAKSLDLDTFGAKNCAVGMVFGIS